MMKKIDRIREFLFSIFSRKRMLGGLAFAVILILVKYCTDSAMMQKTLMSKEVMNRYLEYMDAQSKLVNRSRIYLEITKIKTVNDLIPKYSVLLDRQNGLLSLIDDDKKISAIRRLTSESFKLSELWLAIKTQDVRSRNIESLIFPEEYTKEFNKIWKQFLEKSISQQVMEVKIHELNTGLKFKIEKESPIKIKKKVEALSVLSRINEKNFSYKEENLSRLIPQIDKVDRLKQKVKAVFIK